MLERRGLKDREWAVEWEASALEFLLEKGFTPEMGARPLKRAIDQYVIAPLAATIVEKRFPEGDQFVFVRSDGRAIQAEFVDPDAETSEPEPAHAAELGELPALTSMMLAPSGSDAELAALATESEGVEATMQSAEWEQLKERLAAAMQRERILVAARPLRDARATGADGPCACGGGDGPVAALTPCARHRARRQVLARAHREARNAAPPRQGGHP